MIGTRPNGGNQMAAARRGASACAVAALLLLSACASGPFGRDRDRAPRAPGEELIGRSMTVQAPNGRTTLSFRRDGRVTARFGERRTQGRWAMERRRLCFMWGSFRECWPYRRPFERGETVRIRSDRGNNVQVTLN